MQSVTVIRAENAPAPVGPYSHALACGGLLFLSGQTGLVPATGELAGDLAAQTRQVFANIGAVLAAAGATLEDVLAVDVFLTDLGRFAEFNTIYAEYFSSHKPARTTVGVASLPKGGEVEIKCLARAPRG